MKKKTLVPLIIFLLGICLVGFIVYKTDTHEKNERHITAQLNATTYGERIKNEIASGIEITDALKQILKMCIRDRPEIVLVTKLIFMAGASPGNVICQNCCQLLAPSTEAAS